MRIKRYYGEHEDSYLEFYSLLKEAFPSNGAVCFEMEFRLQLDKIPTMSPTDKIYITVPAATPNTLVPEFLRRQRKFEISKGEDFEKFILKHCTRISYIRMFEKEGVYYITDNFRNFMDCIKVYERQLDYE